MCNSRFVYPQLIITKGTCGDQPPKLKAMKTKNWSVSSNGEDFDITVEYSGFIGKLIVKINEDKFILPNKNFTFLVGRKERLLLGEKMALLVIKPFGEADLVVDGKYLSTGEDYH